MGYTAKLCATLARDTSSRLAVITLLTRMHGFRSVLLTADRIVRDATAKLSAATLGIKHQHTKREATMPVGLYALVSV